MALQKNNPSPHFRLIRGGLTESRIELTDKRVTVSMVIREQLHHYCSSLSVLGIMFTTGTVKSTVLREALKECKFNSKIIFLSSSEILRLIHTPKMLDEFKEIIDEQVLNYNG